MRRIALSACLLLGAARLGAQTPAEERFVPDAETEGAMTLSGRTWTATAGVVVARLQRLSDDERTAFIEHVTGERIDPFRAHGEASPAFETFLLSLENRGTDALSFNPRDCWLSAGRHGVLLPVALEDLGALYRQLESDLPAAYERVRPALLDRRVDLAGGEKLAGLLVYQGLDAAARRYTVDVKVVLPTGDVVQSSAGYRRPEQQKKK